MKRLTYTRTNNPPRLLEELLAKFPQYDGTDGAGGTGEKRDPKITLLTRGQTIEIHVPDDADEAAIGTAVSQHFASSKSVNQLREDTVAAARARLVGYATSNLNLPPGHKEFKDLLTVLGIV